MARDGTEVWYRGFAGTLAVVAVMALGACARRQAAPIGRPVAAAAADDERHRLGALEDANGDPVEEQARWRRIAEIEERAGNQDLAARAARRYVDSAAVTAALADPGTGGEAVRRFEEAVRFAIGLAGRRRDHGLLARVMTVAPDVAQAHKTEVRQAIRAGLWVDEDDRDRLLAWFADDLEIRARLEQRAWEPAKTGLSLEDLARLGPEADVLLEGRLDRALESGDRPYLRKLAGLILARDALNLRARVVVHLLDDAVSVDDALLQQAVGGPWNAGTAVARLGRLLRAQPGRTGVGLALAFRLLEAGLVADARLTIDRVPLAGASEEVRRTAAEIAALSAFGAGDLSAYRAFRAGTDAKGSRYLLEREISSMLPRNAPGPGAHVDDRLRALFAAPLGGREPAAHWAERVAADAEADRSARERAIGVLEGSGGTQPERVRALRRCLAERQATEMCRKRLRVLDALSPDEDDWEGHDEKELTPEVLGPAQDLATRTLAGLARSTAKTLAGLRPWIELLQVIALGSSEAGIRLRVLAAAAAGARADARALMEREQAVLSASVLLELQSVVEDGIETPPAGDAPLASSLGPAALTYVHRRWSGEAAAKAPEKKGGAGTGRDGDDDDRGEGGEDDGEDGEDGDRGGAPGRGARIGALERATAALAEGQHRKALDALLPILDRVDGRAGAELAALVHLAAVGARDDRARRLARARVESLAPRSDAAALVRARDLLDGGQPQVALAAFARALELRPDSHAAAEGVVRAHIAAGTPPETLGRFVVRLGGVVPSLSALARAAADGLLTTREAWQGAVDLTEDPTRALDAGAAIAEAVGQGFLANARLDQTMADAPAAEAAALARRIAGYASTASPHARRRSQLAWAHFVAGDTKASRAAATGPLPASGSPVRPRRAAGVAKDEEPFDAEEPIVLLGGLRNRRDTRFRQDLFRAVVRRQKGAGARLLAMADDTRDRADATILRHVACRVIQGNANVAQVLASCGRVWREGRRAPELATAVSWAVVTDPAATRSAGIDAAAFFAEARRRLRPKPTEALLRNRTLWLSVAGRFEEAAAVADEAWAAGASLDSNPLATEELGLVRFQPLLSRYRGARANLDPGGRHLAVATLAFLAADLEVARAHAEAATFWGLENVAPAQVQYLDLLRDLLLLGQADLDTRLMTRESLARWATALTTQQADELASIERAHPQASVVRVLQIEKGQLQADKSRFIDEARDLERRFPKVVMPARLLFGLLMLAGRGAEARQVAERARARFPGDRRVEGWPTSPKAEDAPVLPPWARSPEGLSAAIAAAPIRAGDDNPSWRRDDAVGAEFALPARFEGFAGSGLGFRHDGVTFVTQRFPLSSHCEGAACLDAVLPGLEQVGFKTVWRRAVSLPGAAGHEALLVGASGSTLMFATVLPLGGHLFLLALGGQTEKIERELATLKLYQDSFRPLDGVLGSKQATALRSAGGTIEPDVALRLEARAAAARPGRGCPLTSTLSKARGAGPRGALLLDAFLATPRVEGRRRLLECAAPDPPLASRLAVAAALDADETIGAWGARAVAAHPVEAMAQIESLLDVTDDEAVAAQGPIERSRAAPFGILQLAGALPVRERPKLARKLMNSSTPRLRALALIAPALASDSVDEADLRRAIRGGTTGEATLAAWALSPSPQADTVQAIRDRLDAVTSGERAERTLALALATRLARLLDPADRTRLRRLPDLMLRGARPATREAAGAAARGLRWLGQVHARATAAAGTATVEDAATREAARWRALPAQRARGSLPAARVAAITREPLASMLPGPAWTFYRVARPGLFAATLTTLFRKVKAAPLDLALTQGWLFAMLNGKLGDGLAAGAGFDLSRPFECARPLRARTEWVCAAHVRDVEAVRSLLARRSGGGRLALDLPLLGGDTAAVLPVAASGLPFFIHRGAFADEPEGEAATGTLVAERVRDRVDVAGVTLDRRVSVAVDTDGRADLTFELLLLRGDRLLAFSSTELAERVLRGAETSLAESAAFRRTTAGWADGGGLQVAYPEDDTDGPLGVAPAGLELAAAAAGLTVRSRFVGNRPKAELAPLLGVMPAGSAAALAMVDFGSANQDRSDPLALALAAPAADVGTPPPVWLADQAQAVTFGWYPPKGGRLWSRWMGAVPWTDGVAKAWRAHRMPPPPLGRPAVHRGIHCARKGDILVFAAERSLLDQALAASPAAAARDPRLIATGSLDGRLVGESLGGLVPTVGSNERARNVLQLFAAIAAVAGRASFEVRLDPQTGEAIAEMQVVPDMTGEARDDAVIDQWLATTQLRNRLKLPRLVGATGDPVQNVTLTVKASSDADLRRAFETTARQTIEPLGSGRARLKLRAGATLDAAAPASTLPVADRRRFLSSEGGGETPEQIRRAASEAIPSGSSPVQAVRHVVAWLRRTMTYELAPAVMSDVTVLERRRGDCTEFSQLAVALLRASGVPARKRSGFMAQGTGLVAHAWVEAHDGLGWRAFDPTNGRTSIDASYLEASVADVLSLLSLGQIAIEAVE